MNDQIHQLLTIDEIAKMLRKSKSSAYNLLYQGKLPGFKVGDEWRFEWDEVLQTLKDDHKANHKPSNQAVN